MFYNLQLPSGTWSLSRHGETLSAYVFVPAERFVELTAVAASGRFQVASIIGTGYHSGLVQNVSLNAEIEEDEEE